MRFVWKNYRMSKKKPVCDRVQVPVTPRVVAALSKRAIANGRSLGREAEQILNKELLSK
jgi:hypothetical protein